MLKLLLLAAIVGLLILMAIRISPKIQHWAKRIMQNSFMRMVLFRVLWRVIRLLIFRR